MGGEERLLGPFAAYSFYSGETENWRANTCIMFVRIYMFGWFFEKGFAFGGFLRKNMQLKVKIMKLEYGMEIVKWR